MQHLNTFYTMISSKTKTIASLEKPSLLSGTTDRHQRSQQPPSLLLRSSQVNRLRRRPVDRYIYIPAHHVSCIPWKILFKLPANSCVVLFVAFIRKTAQISVHFSSYQNNRKLRLSQSTKFHLREVRDAQAIKQ